MGKKKMQYFASSIESFWENRNPRSRIKYDYNGNVVSSVYFNEQGIPVSGTCGVAVTWKMLDANTIEISGTGEMEDYLSEVLPPWHMHPITSVIVTEGVRRIGKRAFSANTQVKSVSYPECCLIIPDDTFAGNPVLLKANVCAKIDRQGGL